MNPVIAYASAKPARVAFFAAVYLVGCAMWLYYKRTHRRRLGLNQHFSQLLSGRKPSTASWAHVIVPITGTVLLSSTIAQTCRSTYCSS